MVHLYGLTVTQREKRELAFYDTVLVSPRTETRLVHNFVAFPILKMQVSWLRRRVLRNSRSRRLNALPVSRWLTIIVILLELHNLDKLTIS